VKRNIFPPGFETRTTQPIASYYTDRPYRLRIAAAAAAAAAAVVVVVVVVVVAAAASVVMLLHLVLKGRKELVQAALYANTVYV